MEFIKHMYYLVLLVFCIKQTLVKVLHPQSFLIIFLVKLFLAQRGGLVA